MIHTTRYQGAELLPSQLLLENRDLRILSKKNPGLISCNFLLFMCGVGFGRVDDNTLWTHPRTCKTNAARIQGKGSRTTASSKNGVPYTCIWLRVEKEFCSSWTQSRLK